MYFVTPMSVAFLKKLGDNDVNVTVSRVKDATEGPQLQEEKYAVGLALLLTLILLGLAVSVLLCLTTRRDPTLWMTVFEGLLPKNSSTHRQFKLPRRVRFQLPDSHSSRGSSKAQTHTLLSPKGTDEESQEQDREDGTITICS